VSVTQQQVLEALARVRSPDGVALTDANVLSAVAVNDGKVFFSINVDAAQVRAWESVRAAAEAAIRAIPGVTTAMMVTLGEDGVKTIEDFAGYAADDLTGWKERKDGETKVFPGVLANHGVSRADAEQMVLNARLKAGWITEDELAAEQVPADEAVGA